MREQFVNTARFAKKKTVRTNWSTAALAAAWLGFICTQIKFEYVGLVRFELRVQCAQIGPQIALFLVFVFVVFFCEFNMAIHPLWYAYIALLLLTFRHYPHPICSSLSALSSGPLENVRSQSEPAAFALFQRLRTNQTKKNTHTVLPPAGTLYIKEVRALKSVGTHTHIAPTTNTLSLMQFSITMRRVARAQRIRNW